MPSSGSLCFRVAWAVRIESKALVAGGGGGGGGAGM